MSDERVGGRQAERDPRIKNPQRYSRETQLLRGYRATLTYPALLLHSCRRWSCVPGIILWGVINVAFRRLRSAAGCSISCDCVVRSRCVGNVTVARSRNAGEHSLARRHIWHVFNVTKITADNTGKTFSASARTNVVSDFDRVDITRCSPTTAISRRIW